MSAAAPVVSTGWVDPEPAIATLLAASSSSEDPRVPRLLTEGGRYRAGLPELEVL